MLACDCSGHSYSASMIALRLPNAASTIASLHRLVALHHGGACGCGRAAPARRGTARTAAPPVHFQRCARAAPRPIRPRRRRRGNPSRARRARRGSPRSSVSSTLRDRLPRFGGRITRACSMPGTLHVGDEVAPCRTPCRRRRAAERTCRRPVVRRRLRRRLHLDVQGVADCLFHSTCELKCWPPISSRVGDALRRIARRPTRCRSRRSAGPPATPSFCAARSHAACAALRPRRCAAGARRARRRCCPTRRPDCTSSRCRP